MTDDKESLKQRLKLAKTVYPYYLNRLLVNRDEFERLKRLDENIKQRIEKLEQANSPCHETFVELEILKRLYDE